MYILGTILNLAAIYMTASIGNAFLIKSGEINLAGEGQIYAGGFIAAIILNLKLPVLINMPLAFILAGTMGTALSVLSAILKKYKNTNYMVTSFLISASIIPIIDSLIKDVFSNIENTNLLATPFILEKYYFSSLFKNFPVNTYFFYAIILCILSALILYKSTFGKEINLYGKANRFALYIGLSESKISISTSALCGFFHGIAGAAAVCGIYHTCHTSFYIGFGWNSLAVALLSFSNLYLIIPFSILMAAIITGANYFAFFNNFNFDISTLIQGIIFFIIAIFSSKLRGKK